MRRRVAITGVGLVSCLGHDYEEVLKALSEGKSGVRAVPEWEGKGLKSLVAGMIDNLDEKKELAKLSKKLTPAMSDSALYCSLAARDAVAEAGWDELLLHNDRTGCIVGSGVGSVDSVKKAADLYYSGRIRRSDPYTVLRCMASSSSAAVANLFKIKGRSYSLSSACATSAHNIGHAYELIRAGVLDRAITGGGEDAAELVAAAFQGLRLALSTHYNDTPTRASRPFDAHRDGFVISGGGGIVVLEDLEQALARGARVRAEIIGYAANSDGFDLVLPEPEGAQAGACMRMAIKDAGIEPERIDYVNTHGTSTIHGDVAEVKGIKSTFDDRIPPFSSTKSMTGHGIGAAGALELIFCIGMMEQGFIAPSINVEMPDPVVEGLPVVKETRYQELTTILSNNFGFGGTNASMVIRRFDG
ncbi:MAG: beta-ketoacyl-[acyl-carrier-protein] synthase family protein [Thermoanaerobaculia bacterium]|jgi:3-oxoacyl-[acyl-carrier-protein] synthase-1